MARKALIHQIEARERRGRWFGALAILLSMSLLLAGWVGFFAFLGANSAYGTIEELQDEWVPDVESMALNLPDLSRISRVYAESGEVLAELHDGRNSQPLPYGEIPAVVTYAVLAAEDNEFFEHSGVDFSAIASAAIDNLIYDTTRGGSTITQQVVKNAFVGNEVSIRRKVNEAFIAGELERRYSKERILEFYMNSVYFGAGAYGVNAAAKEFYNKDIDLLQVHEAATIASLIRNPSLLSPRRNPEITLKARDAVLTQMLEEGWITPAQADYALAQPLGVVDTPAVRGEADHIVAEVKQQLLFSNEFAFLGDTFEERKTALFGCPADDVVCEGGGGLQVLTTIDLDQQKKANEVLNSWLPLLPYEQNLRACSAIFPDFDENPAYYARWAETHSCTPTGAISMVDNHTGAVKVLASGLPFEFSQFNLASQGKRNPGSSFKPFGLVAALENGFTMGHSFAAPDRIEIQCDHPCQDGKNMWTPTGGAGGKVITLETATFASVNTVYAQLSDAVGPANVAAMANRMGIQTPLDEVLSLVLGATAVSTLEMASAYSNFATNGLHAENYIVSRIVDHTGEVIYEHTPETTQVADAAIFAAARRALVKVPTVGTAPKANIGRPQGGKTGTHISNRDVWYVGFTPEYSTAVWVGYEGSQIPLRNVVINGQKYSQVFGGSVPAPIWAEFMTSVMEGLPVTEFPAEPANIRDYLVPPLTTVPVVVGLPEEEAFDLLTIEAKVNVEVVPVPSLDPKGIVVGQSVEPGTQVPQGSFVQIFVSTGETPKAPLPGLIGLTPQEALERIEEFKLETGVQLTLVQVPIEVVDQQLVGKIVETNPSPGTTITESATVLVSIGVLAP